MPNEDNKMLKYNHGEKSMKVPFIIYADLECLPEKLSPYHDNPDLKCLLAIYCVYTVFIWLNKKCAWLLQR